jgi:hypothetical protein
MAEMTQQSPVDPPLPAAAAALTDEGFVPIVPLSFWRRRWVQNTLPWVTSLSIHVALFVLLLLTYKAAGSFFKVIQEQIIIPDASLAPDAGGIPNPGLGNERDRQARQDADTVVNESNGFSQVKNNLTDALVNTPTGSASDQSPVLPGTPGAGVVNTATGALAQFGNPGGGQTGPHGRLFGHGGNAMKIVFVCDASGSMMTKMDLLKLELQKSVQQLQPVQAFDVFFFQESAKGYVSLAPDMLMATAANKKKLYDFLQDVVGQGNTHVIPALTAVFNLPTKPDLVYLLTDGLFEDETGPVVISAIEKLNVDKKVKINTILLLGERKELDDEEMKEAQAVMEKIRKENGGESNPPVSIQELGN